MRKKRSFTLIELLGLPAIAKSEARATARAFRHRFTLIELLVVIVIISVLAALLLPALSKARQIARQTVCINGTKQVNIGAMLYASDVDDYFPNGDSFNAYHDIMVANKYGTADLFYRAGGCPYGPDSYSPAAGDSIRGGSVVGGGTVRVAYALNGQLQHGRGKDSSGAWVLHGPQRLRMGRIQKYAELVAVVICSPVAHNNIVGTDNWRSLWHILGYSQNGTWDIPDPTAARHGMRGLPMALADGHVEFVKPNVVTGGASSWIAGAAPWKTSTHEPSTIMDYSFTYLFSNANIHD